MGSGVQCTSCQLMKLSACNSDNGVLCMYVHYVLISDRDDVKMLNSVVLVPPWQNVWAVALLRPLNNNLTEMLNQHGYGVHVSGVELASTCVMLEIFFVTLKRSVTYLQDFTVACYNMYWSIGLFYKVLFNVCVCRQTSSY